MGLECGRCTEVEHRDEQREKLGEEESDFIQSSCNNDYLVTNTTSTCSRVWHGYSLLSLLSASEAVQLNLCHEVVVAHSLRQLAGHPLHEGVQDTQDDESHLIGQSSLQFHM